MFLLPIFLGCQNKWKCFIVINGALVTQWVLIEIQPTKEENILRQPHRVLFWLYADMMNFGQKKKKKSDEIQPATSTCMCAHRHTRGERWWMILLLDGDLSPKKSSTAWHMLYCWSLFPTGLSALGISSAGQESKNIPVVTKATQCCVELQGKRWGDAQKLGEGWVSLQLSCATFGNRGGAECWPIPVFFNVSVNLQVLAEFWRGPSPHHSNVSQLRTSTWFWQSSFYIKSTLCLFTWRP